MSNVIFALLEEMCNNLTKRINIKSLILRNRNQIYIELLNQKHSDIIGETIDLKKIRTVPKQIAIDIIRYSIKKCNIAAPNSKIIEEIVKTFINSNPGPKSLVTWSRSDKEELAGKIEYQEGYIVISKR